MLGARANGETFVSATMCPQRCVLVCQGLKTKLQSKTKIKDATRLTVFSSSITFSLLVKEPEVLTPATEKNRGQAKAGKREGFYFGIN